MDRMRLLTALLTAAAAAVLLLLPGCRPVPGSDGGAGPTETAAGDLTDYESGIYAIRADSTMPLMMGDVNRDGALTDADAVLALRAAVGLLSAGRRSLSAVACDVDGDDCLTAADARLILRGTAALEAPAGWRVPRYAFTEKLVKATQSTPYAMLTVIDDDGNSAYYRDIFPMTRELGIPVSTAVIAGAVGQDDRHMNWAQIDEMRAAGTEILCHTYNHYLTKSKAWIALDEEGVLADYTKARETFREHGIETRLLVFSGSTGLQEKGQNAARRAGFEGAFLAGDNKVNDGGGDPFKLQRFRIGQTSDAVKGYVWDYDVLTKLVDQAIASGEWNVWMMHTSAAVWNAEAKETLRNVLLYAESKGLPIVTAEYGFSHTYR